MLRHRHLPVPVSRDLLATIDLLPEPMLVVGLDGGILVTNLAFARQLGRPREEFAGTLLSLLAVEPWSEVVDYLRRCAGSTDLLTGSLTLRHPDGGSLEFRAGGAGLDARMAIESADGRAESNSTALMDGDSGADGMRCVLLRLEPRTDSAGFLAILAHELRNPLAPIRNALEVMRVSAGDQAVTTAARSMIERQVQHLVRLTDSLTARPATAPAAEPVAVPPDGSTTRKPVPVRARIVVADDNRDAAQSLAFMLEIEGHDVRTAHDGLEAIEIGESFRPQVVLLDIGMPRLDGYATARELRGRSWGRTACLVALTGWGQEEDRRRAEEAGFDRHLVKPVDPKILNALIAEALQA